MLDTRIRPMLATLADRPFEGDEWIYEIKWDGYRAVSVIKNGKANIYSRNNISFNKQFFPIVKSLEKMELSSAVFDGEIVVLDPEGKSSFSLLHDFLRTAKGSLVYYIFDLIYLDGYDIRGVRLDIRKSILKEIFQVNSAVLSSLVKNLRISDHIEGDGLEFFKSAKERGLEGIIAKKRKSIYEQGKRSINWLKIKIRQVQETIICGYIESEERSDEIVSLLSGIFRKGELVYTGLVGGGLSQKERKDLYLRLNKIKTDVPPFRSVPKTVTLTSWVRPVYVMQVEYTEWTNDGLMRQPVYKGLRLDKDAVDVVFEDMLKTDRTDIVSSPKDPDISGKYEDENNMKKDENIIDFKSRVQLSHPQKIFWPKEKISKKDLFDYYKKIMSYIFPYLKDRLQSLNRCPDGIEGECFYQKNIDFKIPGWLKTKKVYSGSKNEYVNYLICTDPDSLLYMVNMGCIDIHPWSSRVKSMDMPDFAIIDLDPLDVGFAEVVDVAHQVKKVMDEADITCSCKTSGSKGIHIYIPLGARYTYEQALDFTKIIAKIVNSKIPKITSLERQPAKRHNKVYLDCYQNKIGATVAAPYCIRPREGATVSAPLLWDELSSSVNPKDFNIESIFSRLDSIGDIWKAVLGPPIDIEDCIEKIERTYDIKP